MTIRTILVDDERLARLELRNLLTNFADILIIGEAKNLSEALELISTEKPDLVFLDIQLRHENGFELMDKVKPDFKLIFVTAFDEYAVRAFEINALDYLLKPVNPKRLKAALDKVDEKKSEPALVERKLEIDDQLFLNLGTSARFIPINQISHILASGDYSEVFMIYGSGLLVEKPLKEWESRLPENHFIRIHRSTIININEIDSVEMRYNRTMEVCLKNVTKLFSVSRRYTAKFKCKFS